MGELPVRLRPIPMAGDLDLPLIFRLRRLLREERPDLLHLHSRRGPEILGAIAGRLHGVPIIYSRRNDHHESPAITRFKYKLYDRIVAIPARSEERRVGKECVSRWRSRWSPDHKKKKK